MVLFSRGRCFSCWFERPWIVPVLVRRVCAPMDDKSSPASSQQ